MIVLPFDRLGAGQRRMCVSLLGACLAFLAACSAARIAYNNADLYVRWKADEFFELDGAQKALLQGRFDAAARWHRHEELPQYAVAFASAGDRIGAGLTETDIEWFAELAENHYEALVRQTAKGAAEVLSTLSPEQVAHFEAELKRDNERFAEDYVEVSPDKLRKRRFEKTVANVEEWVGTLSDAQRAQIRTLSFAVPLTGAPRLADRERRQGELIAILRDNRTAPTLAPALEAWLLAWDEGRTPEYDALAVETRRRTVSMLLELDRMLTPAQRSRAQSKAYQYAGEFRALARAGDAGGAKQTASPQPLSCRRQTSRVLHPQLRPR